MERRLGILDDYYPKTGYVRVGLADDTFCSFWHDGKHSTGGLAQDQEDLEFVLNKIRQAEITKELLEIMTAVEALSKK